LCFVDYFGEVSFFRVGLISYSWAREEIECQCFQHIAIFARSIFKDVMALPININDLITGQVVEWERIEFKAGWNPEDVIHTLCAYANDFNNWGGGYIIIGIEEENGRPVLPPKGLQIKEADSIQKQLLNVCHRLQPTYFPIAEPVIFQGQLILILWAPGGQNRPFKAPISLAKPIILEGLATQ
jgi:Putative DNA-binding domain